jgi:hypothetical protein
MNNIICRHYLPDSKNQHSDKSRMGKLLFEINTTILAISGSKCTTHVVSWKQQADLSPIKNGSQMTAAKYTKN